MPVNILDYVIWLLESNYPTEDKYFLCAYAVLRKKIV